MVSLPEGKSQGLHWCSYEQNLGKELSLSSFPSSPVFNLSPSLPPLFSHSLFFQPLISFLLTSLPLSLFLLPLLFFPLPPPPLLPTFYRTFTTRWSSVQVANVPLYLHVHEAPPLNFVFLENKARWINANFYLFFLQFFPDSVTSRRTQWHPPDCMM